MKNNRPRKVKGNHKKHTLQAVFITANSAVVTGTVKRSVLVRILFTTAANFTKSYKPIERVIVDEPFCKNLYIIISLKELLIYNISRKTLP